MSLACALNPILEGLSIVTLANPPLEFVVSIDKNLENCKGNLKGVCCTEVSHTPFPHWLVDRTKQNPTSIYCYKTWSNIKRIIPVVTKTNSKTMYFILIC